MKRDRTLITLNTTRVCGGTYFETAVDISNIVYADKFPDSVILANGESYLDAFAATPLIHFPRNGPILFSYVNFIPQNTLEQIYRLQPKGVNGIQIFIVGGISYGVEQYLNNLGFKTRRITGINSYETAAYVAEYLYYPQNIMIIPSENYREGLSACAMAAHMGEPILFASRNELPSYTRKVIQKTKDASVYIIGSTNAISHHVEREIRSLNVKFLDRISGFNPYETAVNFAEYRSPEGDFGWDRTEREGHAFTFTSVLSPFDSVSGSLFAHLGKHTPLLVVSKDQLPETTRNYIESVKPIPAPEPHPPFMHGWVVGCEDVISLKTQLEIERALSIDEAHMGM
jgi:hypothetical protein